MQNGKAPLQPGSPAVLGYRSHLRCRTFIAAAYDQSVTMLEHSGEFVTPRICLRRVTQYRVDGLLSKEAMRAFPSVVTLRRSGCRMVMERPSAVAAVVRIGITEDMSAAGAVLLTLV